jgi:hypothetical protein
MSTITKEWLQQTIADMEEHRDLFPGDLDDNHENVLAALHIALASLEAEAVAYMHRSGQVVTREECCDDKTFAICCKVEMPLYTAPPAPVSVPDEMTPKQASRAYCGEVRGYRDGWNACRAAMLQGAEPVTTAYKLPEGWVAVPVEPTAEMQSAAAGAIRFDTTPINKLWTGNAVYKAMIAAAPRQEVK